MGGFAEFLQALYCLVLTVHATTTTGPAALAHLAIHTFNRETSLACLSTEPGNPGLFSAVQTGTICLIEDLGTG